MLESQIGYFAQKITVTDKAWRDSGKLSIEFPYTVNGQTKVAKSFLPVMEAKMEDEMMLSKERAYLLGKKSTTSFTDSKYPVRTGPGLREQMKGGWTSYFTSQPSAKLFSDYILDITFSRNDSYSRNQTLINNPLSHLVVILGC